MFDKLPLIARIADMIRADPILMGAAIVGTVILIAVVVCLIEARAVQG